mmetsp:Transcript_16251/g.35159  ORF Transcript_16251/g.35159 Transcript_16251/m.35159 type:complete len:246 (-) Transcript_16251:185-922(-)
MSRALPTVMSTRPAPAALTRSRSSSVRAPPAYVTGMGDHLPRTSTSTSSIPSCMPSTSTPCTRNSSQLFASSARVASDRDRVLKRCQRSVTTQYLPSRCLQLRSSTRRCLPTSLTRARSLSSSSRPSRNTYEVTMTWLAPASKYSTALSVLTPPPMCRPPGHARSASKAVALLASSAPSMITWPPRRSSFWYRWEYQEDGLSDTKLVLSSTSPPLLSGRSFRVEPTICFTLPLWMSMHGRNLMAL